MSDEIERDELSSGNLPEVVSQAMVGLRIFCDRERLPDLMMDLVDYCDAAD